MRLPNPSQALTLATSAWLTQDPTIAHWVASSAPSTIMGRIHVGESGLGACRLVILRLKKKRRTFLGLEPWKRSALLLAILARHAENRQLYRDVMGGSIGRSTGTRRRA